MSKKSAKEKHPLFNSWAHARRKDLLDAAWYNDFWLFVREVGERKKDHKLSRIDDTLPLSYLNFRWVPIRQKLKDYESKAAYMRAYLKANPDKAKDYDLKKRFGISLAQFRELQTNQNNKCAICGNPESSFDFRANRTRDLAVDHCHTTGKVRGLLCTNCNQGLGSFKDDKSILQRAIQYLSK